MPLDLLMGDVGQERPGVHCSTDYMQWLCKSIRDAHAMARNNRTKAIPPKRGAMARPIELLCSIGKTGCGAFTHLSVVVKCGTGTEVGGVGTNKSCNSYFDTLLTDLRHVLHVCCLELR